MAARRAYALTRVGRCTRCPSKQRTITRRLVWCLTPTRIGNVLLMRAEPHDLRQKCRQILLCIVKKAGAFEPFESGGSALSSWREQAWITGTPPKLCLRANM